MFFQETQVALKQRSSSAISGVSDSSVLGLALCSLSVSVQCLLCPAHTGAFCFLSENNALFDLTDGRCVGSVFSLAEPVEITKEFPGQFSCVMLEGVTKNVLCFLDLNYEKSAAGLDGLY